MDSNLIIKIRQDLPDQQDIIHEKNPVHPVDPVRENLKMNPLLFPALSRLSSSKADFRIRAAA